MGYTIADDGVVEVCEVCDSVTYDTDSTPWRPIGCECDSEDGGDVMREHAARLSREVGANRHAYRYEERPGHYPHIMLCDSDGCGNDATALQDGGARCNDCGEVCGREDCNYPIADCGHGEADESPAFDREREGMLAAGHTGTRCAHCGGFREEYTNYVRELGRVIDVYNPHCVQCWVDGHGNARDQRVLGVICEDFDCAISAAHDCIRRGIAEDWHPVAVASRKRN